MPPHAAATQGGGLTEYSDRLDAGTTVKLADGPQFGASDFKPVKALGNGDMGNVYLVAQRNNNAPYAMKVMKKNVLRVRKSGHRARAEREILASVNHPFFPVLHSHFEDEKHLFLVISYCQGGDLNVMRQKQPEKRFSESACRFYIAEVLLALEYLHKRNIVYRDLKPENILIQATGHIMLTDFDLSLDLSERMSPKSLSSRSRSTENSRDGMPLKQKKKSVNHLKALFACGNPMVLACGSPMVLAKKPSKKSPNARVTPEELYIANRKGSRRRASSSGPAHSFVGTEEYVAPEIIIGRGHGLPVDWWTLGILLYELYYGKTPFKGVNRKETFYNILCKNPEFPGISTPLTDLIRLLLVKEPEKRLGTKGGAEEIKKHPFFTGVKWNELMNLSRTPVVPEPFSWEQIEKEKIARAKATGKEPLSNWSFCEISGSTQEKNNESAQETSTVIKSPSDSLSMEPNDSQQGARVDNIADKFVGTIPSDYGVEDEDVNAHGSDDTLDRQPVNLQQLTPKEEVRLEDEESKLFGDVF